MHRPMPRTAATTRVISRLRWAVMSMRLSACLAADSSAPTVCILSRMCKIVSRCAAKSPKTPWLTSSDSRATLRASSNCLELRSNISVLRAAPCSSGLAASPSARGAPGSRSLWREVSSRSSSSWLRSAETSRDHSWSRWSHSCREVPAAPDNSSRTCTCTKRRLDSISSRARSAALTSSLDSPPAWPTRNDCKRVAARARRRRNSFEYSWRIPPGAGSAASSLSNARRPSSPGCHISPELELQRVTAAEVPAALKAKLSPPGPRKGARGSSTQ
mmetsp:Transcript_35732/g.96995  ORF Transcript_35732/g.96995 Transcript_35732/m.96995 type:complete len:274 (+) Transcript_35732:237-1058(+)